MEIDDKTLGLITTAQRNEITEYHIYTRLADKIKHAGNTEVLRQVGRDERSHYDFWQGISGREVKPSRWRIFFFFWVARLFGITFGIKLMEQGEDRAQKNYLSLCAQFPEAKRIIEDEEAHEQALLEMLHEEHLQYVGSMVLGLNDALVELTGTLAGLTFALNNARLTALSGLITGIAASLSMAASEYLSARSGKEDDESSAHPLKSSLYTGAAYVLTVVLLVVPYLVLGNPFIALSWTIANVVLVILIFNFYIAVAKGLSFRRRFWEMFAISIGVAALSFGIGLLVKMLLGVEV
jgi:VIT1/CCC1 family predicted Fe2+/Mn2+ transporter